MAKRQVETSVTDADVLSLRQPLSDFVSAWLGSPDAGDEIVQETLTRVLESRSRLESRALRAYALAVARNLIISATRTEDVARRHRHRLVEPATSEAPEQVVLRREEWAALTAAFARLPARDRQLLFAHEVEQEDTATLAGAAHASPGAIAAALARARARLRLEYLLTRRRVDLPSARCRSVLLSLSTADRHRQRALAAGQHLLSCPVCADLAPPLEARRRALLGLLPLGWLTAAARRLRQAVREHPVQAGTAATVAAAIAAVAAAAGIDSPSNPVTPPPAPVTARPSSTAGTVFVGTVAILPLPPMNRLTTFIGKEVRSSGVAVESVPADEGFWIGRGTDRLWVRLASPGESAVHIRAGQEVAFRGHVAANPADFARRIGVTSSEGADQLDRQGVHILVAPASLSVH
jgi:RNA polymerase sigma factor (sigma-70 family)